MDIQEININTDGYVIEIGIEAHKDASYTESNLSIFKSIVKSIMANDLNKYINSRIKYYEDEAMKIINNNETNNIS